MVSVVAEAVDEVVVVADEWIVGIVGKDVDTDVDMDVVVGVVIATSETTS